MPTDPTEADRDEGLASDAKSACPALIPPAITERRSRRRWYRWAPDPIFVTHLIAEAEQVPQARCMRRASLADAQAAYRPHPAPAQGIGSRMRQEV